MKEDGGTPSPSHREGDSPRPAPATGILIEHRRLVHAPAGYVEGELWIDGERWCHLLEDPWRDLLGIRGPREEKVPGRTCIPAGTYRLAVTRSPRFGKKTAEILDVPLFTHVRYHSGAHVDHTEGCPLLGRRRAGPGRLVPDPALTDALAALLESRPGEHHVVVTDKT